jgi:hypothetical protein
MCGRSFQKSLLLPTNFPWEDSMDLTAELVALVNLTGRPRLQALLSIKPSTRPPAGGRLRSSKTA